MNYSDDGALLPPRKKSKRKKDGSFAIDKSKGKLKTVTCFADEFDGAPNYNDLPEVASDPLDKHLGLGDESSDDDASDSSSSITSTVSFECDHEEVVDDETWKVQEDYLAQVARDPSRKMAPDDET